jgi:hypothetical protein
MMSYTTQELSLQLPSSKLQDSSINILRFNDFGTSLVITRGVLGDGETLHSHFEAQIAKLTKQVKDLRASVLQDIQLGSAQTITGVELRSQFSKGPEQVYQFQLGVLLGDGRRLLALSYVKPTPLDDADAAHWAQIKHSLSLNG